MEVHMHWFAIYGDLSSTKFHIGDCSTLFSLTSAPSLASIIKNSLSFSYWDGPSDIEQVNSVKLGELIWVDLEFTTHGVDRSVRLELGVPTQVSPQMML